MTRQPVKIVLIRTGSQTPAVFGPNNGDVFECVKHIDLASQAVYENCLAQYATEVFRFAELPRNWTAYYIRNLVSIVSNLGAWANPPPNNPKLVVITEDLWIDSPTSDQLFVILTPILDDPRWRRFALLKGVLTCLITNNRDSLGEGESQYRVEQLLSRGVDLILNASELMAVDATIEKSAGKIRDRVLRRYALLSRERKWATESFAFSLIVGLVAFFGFGLSQAISTAIVSSLGWPRVLGLTTVAVLLVWLTTRFGGRSNNRAAW